MKTDKYRLEITYKDVYKAFLFFRDVFATEYNATLHSRNDIPLNSGKSNIKQKWTYIGEFGIADKHPLNKKPIQPKRLFKAKVKNRTKITDAAFVLYITSGFHELQHFGQQEHEYQGLVPVLQGSEVDVALYETIQAFSLYDNQLHYETNYTFNISELDAEKHGFLEAYEYLTGLFPDKKEIIDEIFVEVYNYKASFPEHWLHYEHLAGRFHIIEDINDAFNKAILRLCDKEFATTHWHSLETIGLSRDTTAPLINYTVYQTKIRSEQAKEWQTIYESLLNAKGHDSDLKLAALVEYFNPNKKYDFKKLDTVNLSMISNFGLEPPKIEIQENSFSAKNLNLCRKNLVISKIEKEKYIPQDSDLKQWIQKHYNYTNIKHKNVSLIKETHKDNEQPYR